jgi:hypothetical protein
LQELVWQSLAYRHFAREASEHRRSRKAGPLARAVSMSRSEPVIPPASARSERAVDVRGPKADRPGSPGGLSPSFGMPSAVEQWLLYALVGSALVLFALWAINPVPCSDLWWQLKTGELIWHERAIPSVDRFSFTAAGNPWIIQEWATEVLFFLLYSKGSASALVLFKMLSFAGAMGVGLAAAWTRCRSGLVAAAAALIVGYAAHYFADMRPQMITYLCLALLLLLLEIDRAVPGSRARWLLAPLMLLWVNFHAGFMAGVTVLLAALVGVATETVFRARPASERANAEARPDPWKRLLLPVGLALLATGVNPYGFSIYVYPFTLLQHNSMVNFVQEWFSPDFHAAYLNGYQLCLFLVPVLLLLSGRRKRPADMLLALFWAHQSLVSRRHVPIFLIVILPLLAEHVVGAGERIGEWIAELGRIELLVKDAQRPARLRMALTAGLLSFVGLGIGQQAQGLPRARLFDYSAGLSFFPQNACDFIERQGWSGRLYNEFDWGGYCIWRFYPRQQVFIDGRCEVYFQGAWENHQAVHYAQADWEQRLRDTRVDTLLINPNSYLNRVLPTSHEWTRVYADSTAWVFRRVHPFAP